MLTTVRLSQFDPPLPALEQISVAQDVVRTNLVEADCRMHQPVKFFERWQHAMRQSAAGQLQCALWPKRHCRPSVMPPPHGDAVVMSSGECCATVGVGIAAVARQCRSHVAAHHFVSVGGAAVARRRRSHVA